MTLLEKAKAVDVRKADAADRVELAVAFAHREITPAQAAAALECSLAAIHGSMAGIVLGAIRRGEYRLVKVEEPDAPNSL